jgi:hypothetical protein
MNKKGSFADLLYLALVVLVLGIMFTVGWAIFSKVNDKFQDNSQISTLGKEMMQSSTDRYVELFDNLFLTVFISMYIASLILAWNVDISPVFFFLSIFIFVLLVIVTASFGNAFWDYSQQTTISGYVDDFNIIPFVFNNLVQVFVVMGFGLMVVMYAKNQ